MSQLHEHALYVVCVYTRVSVSVYCVFVCNGLRINHERLTLSIKIVFEFIDRNVFVYIIH